MGLVRTLSGSRPPDSGPRLLCWRAPTELAQNVQEQFEAKWDTGRYGQKPAITAIYQLNPPDSVLVAFNSKAESIGYVKTHSKYAKNPGNKVRRFHGTSMPCKQRFDGTAFCTSGCPVCGIIQNGFQLSYLGKAYGNLGRFGKGHYATSKGSTAYDYAKGPKKDRPPAVIVVNVVAGYTDKVQVQGGPTPWDPAHALPLTDGLHSRVADKNFSGAFEPVDEIMVPEDAQLLPAYLIVFV